MENLEMVNGELQLVISPGETVNIKKGVKTDVPVSIRDVNSTEDKPTIINLLYFFEKKI